MKSTNTTKRLRKGRAASVAQATILSIAWLAQPEAAAGVVTFDGPAPDPSWSSDFSSFSLGEPVDTLTFTSNLGAFDTAVSSDSSVNEVTDEGVWRLQGGATTLDFGSPMESFWFSYEHKNNAAVRVSFLDADGAILDTVDLDGKAAQSGSVEYSADSVGFSSMTVTWIRGQGQWFEIGPVLNASPAFVPAPASLAMAGVVLAAFGRRRDG